MRGVTEGMDRALGHLIGWLIFTAVGGLPAWALHEWVRGCLFGPRTPGPAKIEEKENGS